MAAGFHLQVVSLDGMEFDGQAVRASVRGQDGELAIMKGHTNYCTALGMGEARILLEDGTERRAACIGGMLSVMDGEARIISTTWEWSDEIDLDRAKASRERAEKRLSGGTLSDKEYKVTMAKLRRALVRIDVAG